MSRGWSTVAYEPKPVDAARVVLTPEILELTERLAENAHDIWGAKRIAEGWTLGPKKDGELMQTPLLVPYGELPESEKQYDRDIALATLKAIIALGYRIVPPK
jgi:RyR domain